MDRRDYERLSTTVLLPALAAMKGDNGAELTPEQKVRLLRVCEFKLGGPRGPD